MHNSITTQVNTLNERCASIAIYMNHGYPVMNIKRVCLVISIN